MRTEGKESDLFYQTTLKELKIHTYILVRTVCLIQLLTPRYCRWGRAGTHGTLPTCPAAAAAARHHQSPLRDGHSFTGTPLWGQWLLVATGGYPSLIRQTHRKRGGSCSMSLHGDCQQIKGLWLFDSIVVFRLFYRFINLLFVRSY